MKLTSYIRLKEDEKIIDDLPWLKGLKSENRISSDVIERHSGVNDIDNDTLNPAVKDLWNLHLNLAIVLQEELKGQISFFVSNNELRLTRTTENNVLGATEKFFNRELKLSADKEEKDLVHLSFTNIIGDQVIEREIPTDIPDKLQLFGDEWLYKCLPQSKEYVYNSDYVEEVFEFWLTKK